jgi:predicted small integral membrane protein
MEAVSFLIAKTIVVAGLALWAIILVVNNIMDNDTNRNLVSEMMSMDRIRNNPQKGGVLLLKRAVHSPSVHAATIYLAIAIQLAIITLLGYSAFEFVSIIVSGNIAGASHAVTVANFGFCAMFVMWFLFLCGGLWHAYWINMWDVQQVHMTMLIVTIAAIIFINQTLA